MSGRTNVLTDGRKENRQPISHMAMHMAKADATNKRYYNEDAINEEKKPTSFDSLIASVGLIDLDTDSLLAPDNARSEVLLQTFYLFCSHTKTNNSYLVFPYGIPLPW